MDTSPFGNLPPEIRNNIYELVLLSEDPIRVTCEAAATPSVPLRYKFLPGLIATCKQIRSECEQIYFKRNTFHLEINPRPAKFDFRPYCDEAHSFWAFLNNNQRCRFSTPKHITTRISRSFSTVSEAASLYYTGSEVWHQLSEIEKFAIGRNIEKVECVVESSWGFTAAPESTLFDMKNLSESARSGYVAYDYEHRSGLTAYQPASIVKHFHYKTLKRLSNVCEIREKRRIDGAKSS